MLQELPNVFSPYNAFLPGTSHFTSDQAVADLDWNVCAKDSRRRSTTTSTIPTPRPTRTRTSPDLRRTWTPDPRWPRSTMCRRSEPASVFLKPSAFSARRRTATNDQLLRLARSAGARRSATICFRRHDHRAIDDHRCARRLRFYVLVFPVADHRSRIPTIREPTPACSRTGSCPPATAIWTKGRHSVSFGGSYSYTQLNIAIIAPARAMWTRPTLSRSPITGSRPTPPTLCCDHVSPGQRQSLLSRQPDRALCSG